MSRDNIRPQDPPHANIRPGSALLENNLANDALERLTSATHPAATAQGARPTQGPNALHVFLSALPSDIAFSLASQYSIPLLTGAGKTGGFPTQTSQIPASSKILQQTSRSQLRPSASLTTTPTSSSLIPTRPRPTVRPTTRPPPTPFPSTPATSTSTSAAAFSTVTRSSSTTSSILPTASTAAPAPRLANASVAGIATGVAAGAVVVLLAVLFLFRRRQQGKAPFAPRVSQPSERVYPEAAWLYDPTPSPPPEGASHDRHASERAFLTPHGRATEMTPMASPSGTPEPPAAQPESPLLPPPMPAARDSSPSGSPSGSNRSSGGPNARKSGRSAAASFARMVPITEEPR